MAEFVNLQSSSGISRVWCLLSNAPAAENFSHLRRKHLKLLIDMSHVVGTGPQHLRRGPGRFRDRGLPHEAAGMDPHSVEGHAGASGPPASGGTRLNITGLDGSTFQVDVAESSGVLDVCQKIEGRIGLQPGRRLVLMSGGKVLSDSQLMREQVLGNEITYVVQQVGACQAALALLRALGEDEKTSVGTADRAAINAVSSVSFDYGFNLSLERCTLPENLLTLSFGYRFNQSLEGRGFLD